MVNYRRIEGLRWFIVTHTNKHRELNSSGCCLPVLNDSKMLLSSSPLPDTQVSSWAVVPSAVMEDQHSPPPLQRTVKDTNENLHVRSNMITDTLTKSKVTIYNLLFLIFFWDLLFLSDYLHPNPWKINIRKYNEVPLLKGQSHFWGSCVEQSYCKASTASCNRRGYDQRKLWLWFWW